MTRWPPPPAFADFVRARHTALLRFAYVLCGDEHRAADLVQDALERTALAAHGASVAGAYDPLDGVIEGGGPRRRKALVIRLVVTLAAIVALAAAVPIVGSPRSAPAEPPGVPWVDQPDDLGDAAADR